jgi:pyrophosphatase PpaX
VAGSARRPFGAVVFDLDGTLVDTAALHVAASHHAALEVLGRDVDETTVRASLGHPLPTSMAVLARGAGLASEADVSRAVPALMESFLAYYRAHQDELVAPFPRVPATLATPQKRGYRLGLLSNKLRDWGRAELGTLGLAPYFAVTVFAEDMPAPKPAAAALKPVLGALRVGPSDVLVVGDSAADVECARAAGAVAALALWGAMGPTELPPVRPDYVLSAIEEILNLCPSD